MLRVRVCRRLINVERELGCEGRGGGKVARVDGVFVGVTVEERVRE